MDKYPWLEKELLGYPGACTDYKAEWKWERYLVNEKMFAAVCQPGPEYPAYGGRKMIILKGDPMESELLRKEYPDIIPGFYSDKSHWNSVYLDGEVPDELLKHLCTQSYRLVFEKLTKKVQRQILEQSNHL